MIEIRRDELRELGFNFVIANTPASLYQLIVGSKAFQSLKAVEDIGELESLFNRLTARSKRTEFSMGLAYAVICAIGRSLESKRLEEMPVDRLKWGTQVRDLASALQSNNQFFTLPRQPDGGPPVPGKLIITNI